MNLDHLRAFCTVVERGSFTVAADRLHLTQPAVSQQVKALEIELGARLLTRAAHEVRLTSEGKVAYRYGRTILALAARTADRIQRLARARAIQVRMGVSLSVGEHFLPRILGPFNAQHPDAEVELLVASSVTVAQRVADGDLDIGILEGPISHGRLDADLLMDNELILVVAPWHPLATSPSIPRTELACLPLIVREEGSGTRNCLSHALAAAGIPGPRACLVLSSNQAVKSAVQSGLGAAFLSHITVLTELETHALVRVETLDFSIPRPILLVRRRGDRSPGPLTHELINLLTARTFGVVGPDITS